VDRDRVRVETWLRFGRDSWEWYRALGTDRIGLCSPEPTGLEIGGKPVSCSWLSLEGPSDQSDHRVARILLRAAGTPAADLYRLLETTKCAPIPESAVLLEFLAQVE